MSVNAIQNKFMKQDWAECVHNAKSLTLGTVLSGQAWRTSAKPCSVN